MPPLQTYLFINIDHKKMLYRFKLGTLWSASITCFQISIFPRCAEWEYTYAYLIFQRSGLTENPLSFKWYRFIHTVRQIVSLTTQIMKIGYNQRHRISLKLPYNGNSTESLSLYSRIKPICLNSSTCLDMRAMMRRQWCYGDWSSETSASGS